MRHVTAPTLDELPPLLDRAAALGVPRKDLDPVREAIAYAEEIDPDDIEIIRSLSGARKRVAARIADGTLTVDQARAELNDTANRVTVDKELSLAVTDAHNRRAATAIERAGHIPWAEKLTPIGTDAATKVVELAEKLPDGMDDSTAVRGSERERKAWVAFGEAVNAWRGTVALLDTLRWRGLISFGPIPREYRDGIAADEWFVTGESALELRERTRPQGAGVDRRGDLAVTLDEVKSGVLVPACVTTQEMHERLSRRRDLREVNVALVSAGFAVPGADIPSRAALPSSAPALVSV